MYIASSVVIITALGVAAGTVYGLKQGKSTNLAEVVAANGQLGASEHALDISQAELAKSKLQIAELRKLLEKSESSCANKGNELSETSENLTAALNRLLYSDIALKKLEVKIEALSSELFATHAKLNAATGVLTKIEQEKRAELKEQASNSSTRKKARKEASDASVASLNEYYLDADSESAIAIRSAAGLLTRMSAACSIGDKSKIGNLAGTPRHFRECSNVVRIAGNIIPKDCEYTLYESWVWYLSAK